MARSSGGILWRTLSIEQDLLQGVLLHLDCASLVNIELTSSNFREFMQRTHTWRKKFELCENSDQTLRSAVADNSDSSHTQYKRMCLKLVNLKCNLKSGKCRKTRTELPTVFGNYNSGLFNHSLKAMHPDLVFVEGILRDLENSLVFDVKAGSRKSLMPPPFPGVDCRVRSVDVSADQVCLIRTPSPEHPAENFCIVETYTVNAFNDGQFSLSSQSEPQEREDFGVGLKVKIAGDERFLVLTFNMFGNESMHARVNILEIDPNYPTSPHPQRLVVTRKIKCVSEDLFSKLSIFDENHLVGCAGPEDQVEVWNLKREVGGHAEKVWSKRVVTEFTIPRIRITALEFKPPILLVGKTNGRVEVWNTEKDVLVRTLEHGLETGLKMAVIQICVQDQIILCLTEAGWMFAWDWAQCVTLDKAEVNQSWRIKPKPGVPIINFVVSPTEILSLEGGPGRRFMYLVKRDFLNHVEKATDFETIFDEKTFLKRFKIPKQTETGPDPSKRPKLNYQIPKLNSAPVFEIEDDPTDEEDVVLLDEDNVDSEDVVFLGNGNVIVLE